MPANTKPFPWIPLAILVASLLVFWAVPAATGPNKITTQTKSPHTPPTLPQTQNTNQTQKPNQAQSQTQNPDR